MMESGFFWIGLILLFLGITAVWVVKNDQLTTLIYSIITVFYAAYTAMYYSSIRYDMLVQVQSPELISFSLFATIYFVIMSIYGWATYLLAGVRKMEGED